MTGVLGLISGGSLIPALIGAAGVAVVAGGGIHYADSVYYGKQISDLKLQSAQNSAAGYQKALDKFVLDSAAVSEAARRFQVQQLDLQAQFSAIRSAFSAATQAHALPASCVPDAERLRVLAAAISAANSAAASARPGIGRALPGPVGPSHR